MSQKNTVKYSYYLRCFGSELAGTSAEPLFGRFTKNKPVEGQSVSI